MTNAPKISSAEAFGCQMKVQCTKWKSVAVRASHCQERLERVVSNTSGAMITSTSNIETGH
jgi:hypothetical protein